MCQLKRLTSQQHAYLALVTLSNIKLMDFTGTGGDDWDWSISDAGGGGSRMVPSSFYNVNPLSDNFQID